MWWTNVDDDYVNRTPETILNKKVEPRQIDYQFDKSQSFTQAKSEPDQNKDYK